MGVAQITNPDGLYGDDALPHAVDIPVKCSVAVAINALVEIAYTEATDVFHVRPAGTGVSATPGKVGVALETGAIGDTIMVRIGGPAKVNIGAGAVAVGEQIILTATAGEADGAVADAATIVGTTYGRFVSDEIGATNTAMVWLNG
jgi:hypothetical protein